MPRYELASGTSNKYWAIEKAKRGSYHVSWGRVGSAGQTQVKKLSAAQYVRLVAEKLKKGDALANAKPAPTSKPAPKSKSEPSNAGLEATLYEAIVEETAGDSEWARKHSFRYTVVGE